MHVVLIAAFLLSAVSLVLRSNKVLGFAAITITLFATILGGSRVHASGVGELTGGFFLGLDWFILNLIFTGLLFVPLESLFARNREQPLFRDDWREDIFYFLISSLLVQVLTFLSLRPSLMILSHTHWTSFRSWVGSQPFLVQLIEIMFLTDVVQYWVHRAFHRVPFLWGFHAVHHSPQHMDWLAGADAFR